MSVRELLNRQSTPFSIIAALLLVVAGAWLLISSMGNERNIGVAKAFYTIDDGKSVFVADSANIPPFSHDGKTAVQAMMFTADGGKTRFVGYLMQFTERGQAKLREARAKADRPAPTLDPELQVNTQVKKPGEANWVSLGDLAAAGRVMQVTAPNDPSKIAEPVDP